MNYLVTPGRHPVSQEPIWTVQSADNDSRAMANLAIFWDEPAAQKYAHLLRTLDNPGLLPEYARAYHEYATQRPSYPTPDTVYRPAHNGGTFHVKELEITGSAFTVFCVYRQDQNSERIIANFNDQDRKALAEQYAAWLNSRQRAVQLGQTDLDLLWLDIGWHREVWCQDYPSAAEIPGMKIAMAESADLIETAHQEITDLRGANHDLAEALRKAEQEIKTLERRNEPHTGHDINPERLLELADECPEHELDSDWNFEAEEALRDAAKTIQALQAEVEAVARQAARDHQAEIQRAVEMSAEPKPAKESTP